MSSNAPITGVYNDGAIAELYEQFRRDPASVDETWRQYFRFAEQLAGTAPSSASADPELLHKVAGAAGLVSAIQRYGHMQVQIDPLGSTPPGAAEMTPEFHGITESDLRQIPAQALGGTTGTAADFVNRMRELWCGAIGFEYDHLENDKEREWFRQTIESQRLTAPLSTEEKRALLRRMTEVDGLERFLGLAFVNVKRFSIEGVDALVPII